MSNFIPNLFAVPAKPNWRTVQQDRYVCSDKESQEIYSKYLPGVKIPDSCDAELYKQVDLNENIATTHSLLQSHAFYFYIKICPTYKTGKTTYI